MFINRDNNSKFTGTIIKYDDTMSSISLDGNVSVTLTNDKKQKDVLIIDNKIIDDWEQKYILKNDNSNYYLNFSGSVVYSTQGTSIIHYFRAQDGFIEYNNYGNVNIEGVGIFNAFNKILYLQNGFLIRMVEKNKNVFELIIKHHDLNNNIILKKDEALYISDKILLKKEDNDLLDSDTDTFEINGDCFTIGIPKQYNTTDHQIITIYKDENKIISFDFLSGFILYYLDHGNKGFIKIISRERFEVIPESFGQS